MRPEAESSAPCSKFHRFSSGSAPWNAEPSIENQRQPAPRVMTPKVICVESWP